MANFRYMRSRLVRNGLIRSLEQVEAADGFVGAATIGPGADPMDWFVSWLWHRGDRARTTIDRWRARMTHYWVRRDH